MIKLLERLSILFPDSSRTTLKEWISQGRISLGGRILKSPDLLIQETAVPTLSPKKKFAPLGIEILYEDRDIVVVEKPEGLLSVGTPYQKEKCLHTILKRRHHRTQVFPVHRLDKETSGILVFAYTIKARDVLKKLFEKHDLLREYQAVVYGTPSPAEGTWEHRLFEDARFYVHVSENGKLATTHYRTLASHGNMSLLSIRLETGRKNQIRVQSAASGHPLVGDPKYGKKDDPHKRLYLHACFLSFHHPLTGKTLSFTSSFHFDLKNIHIGVIHT